jgi:hypothetical protein
LVPPRTDLPWERLQSIGAENPALLAAEGITDRADLVARASDREGLEQLSAQLDVPTPTLWRRREQAVRWFLLDTTPEMINLLDAARLASPRLASHRALREVDAESELQQGWLGRALFSLAGEF